MTVEELLEHLHDMGTTPSLDHAGPPQPAEPFTELDHGLQCAYELALTAPDDLGLQVAGLVHDIGHRFGDDESHGRLGAEAVRPLFGARVAELVAGHVPAKRYLVTMRPGYAELLSAISTQTLAVQGGGMSDPEIVEFRLGHDWQHAVRLRLADDAAKTPGRTVPSLDHWIEAIRQLACDREHR